MFTYEWKRPFNEESGKKATSEVTCPCCKSNLSLDLKAKPDDNQEMELLVEIKSGLDLENVWTAIETGVELGEGTSAPEARSSGEERTSAPALSSDAPAVTAPNLNEQNSI